MNNLSERYLFFTTEQGDFGVFKYDKKRKDFLTTYQRKEYPDHKGPITLIEILPQKKLILTYSEVDNHINVYQSYLLNKIGMGFLT